MINVIEKNTLISNLHSTPMLLSAFIGQIPVTLLKSRRKPNKWSIHEHACHLAQAEVMIHERFIRFEAEDQPEFKPYLPGNTISDGDLIYLDLSEQLHQFESMRAKTLNLLKSFDDGIWSKEGKHPEYINYSPFILLRHLLMHDHFHMYRMEELWLTKQEYL